MAKQLNIDMRVTADVSQAKQNLQQLQTSLNQIASIKLPKNALTSDIQSAVTAAKSLQGHLQSAMNTQTGNIDLSKFQNSLKLSNESLSTLSTKLLGAGMVGEQSFLQIHKALSSAHIQLNKTDGLLSQFATTLKNTARWQLSSSILHGFMGALQTAYGYSQDLNKSLTDIRVVTGLSVEDMSRFADEANRAARALSTTTNEYAKGSLIYYQQGLSAEEVQKRTETTVKLAQVSRQTAEETSNQLTAIWNNFYDGSKSLEYYADVLTKLGAATASSTQEIAGGLEKFAAIGETIGLSYEYAAAALATITANTRQSEEVVGTALKTIFARIQGLKLGETLEDGTSLNKYSQALQSVGISIFDQNKQLKDMDIILAEMGAKWQTLSRDQQTALAQTVAGIRQYTQLMSLMKDWDSGDSDSMIANLQHIQSAEGELNSQHETYAEGWEAASDRVRAAFENIYKSMVPDETFIDLLNIAEDLVTTFGTVIDTLGGLEGVIGIIATAFITKFQPSIVRTFDLGVSKIQQLKSNLVELTSGKGLSGIGQMLYTTGTGNSLGKHEENNAINQYENKLQNGSTQLSKEFTNSLGMAKNHNMVLTDGFKSQINSLDRINQLSNLISVNRHNLTNTEKEILSTQLQQAQAISEQLAKQKDQIATIRQQQEALKDNVVDDMYGRSAFDTMSQYKGYDIGFSYANREQAINNKMFAKNNLGMKTQNVAQRDNNLVFSDEIAMVETHEKTVDLLQQQAKFQADINRINSDTVMTDKQKAAMITEYSNQVKSTIPGMQNMAKSTAELAERLGKGEVNMSAIRRAISTGVGETRAFAQSLGISEETLNDIVSNGRNLSEAIFKAQASSDAFDASLGTVGATLNRALSSAVGFGNQLLTVANSANRVAMAVSAISNFIDTLKDPDVGWVQKLVSGTMAASMGLSALINTLQGVQNVFIALNGVQAANNAVTAAGLVLKKNLTADEAKSLIIKEAITAAENKQTAAELAGNIVEKTGMDQKRALGLAELLLTGLKNDSAIATAGEATAQAFDNAVTAAGAVENYKYAASQYAKLGPIALVIAALTALIAVMVLVHKESEKQSTEAQLKRSAAAAEELKKASDEANESAKQLRSTFESYKTARDKLAQCTAGTKEWNEALKESNDLALQLINNLPADWNAQQIQEAYSRDSSGMIQLDEDTVEVAQKELDKEAQIASYASELGQLDVLEKKIDNDINTALGNRYIGYQGQYTPIYGGTGSYETDAIKNVIDNIEQINDMTIQEFENYMSEQKFLLGDSIDEIYKQFTQLANSAEATAQKLKLVAGMKVDEQLGDDFDTDTKNMVTQQVANQTERYKQEYLNKLTDKNGQGYGLNKAEWASSKQAKQFLSDYNEITGKNWGAANNFVIGTDNSRSFKFINEEGKEVTKTAEMVAQEMAAAKALEDLSGSAQKAQSVLNSIGDNDAGKVLKEFYSEGTSEKLTSGQLNNLKNDQGDITYDTGKNFLIEAFGSEDKLNQAATKLGISVDDMINDFIDSANAANTSLNTVVDNLTKTVKEKFKEINTVDMSVEDQKNLANTMSQIFGNFGKDGLDEFMNMFPKESAHEFANALNNIDWNNTSIEQVHQELEKVGLTSNEISNIDLPRLCEIMKKTSQVGIEAAQQQYTAIQKIINSINGDYGIIDQEQYQKLAEAGVAVEAYFTQMTDGTYMLMQDASEFKEVLNDISLKPMRDAAQDAIQKVQDLKSGYSLLTTGTVNVGDKTIKSKDPIDFSLGYTTGKTETDSQLAHAIWDAQANALKANGMEASKVEELRSQAYANNNSSELAKAIKEAGLDSDKIKANFEEAAQEAHKIQKAIEESEFNFDIEKYGLDLEKTREYAEELEEQYKKTGEKGKDYSKIAKEMAIANQRLDRGMADINDNLDDYNKKLKNSNKGTAEYSETMSQFKDSIADIANIADGDMISSDFAESLLDGGKNAEMFKQALNGDTDAILALRLAAADAIMLSIANNLPEASQDLEIFKTAWQNAKNLVESGDITVPGADATNLINSLNAMIEAGNMTKTQIEAAMSGLNISAEVHTDYVEQDVTVPSQITYETVEPNGSGTYNYYDEESKSAKTVTVPLTKRTSFTVPGPEYTAKGYVPKYTVTGNTDGDGGVSSGIIKMPAPTASKGSTTSGRSNNSGGGGGGGGSKGSSNKPTIKSAPRPEKPKTKRYSEEIDMYKEILDVMEETNREMDELNDATDYLYGASKVSAMQDIIDKQKELNKYQNDYLWEIKQTAKEQKIALTTAVQYKEQQVVDELGQKVLDENGNPVMQQVRDFTNKDALGIEGIEFDEQTGKIMNWEWVNMMLIDKYNAAEKAFVDELNANAQERYDIEQGKIAMSDEEKEKRLAQLDARDEVLDAARDENDEIYEIRIDALKNYDESVKLVQEQEAELRRMKRQVQEQILEKIDYEVQIKVDLNEFDRKLDDYFIDKYSQKLDTLGDGAKRIKNSFNTLLTSVDLADDKFEEIRSKVSAGELEIDDLCNYIVDEGLDSVLDALELIDEELERTMEYYPEAADVASEAFNKIYDQIDRNMSLLENYRDILDLISGPTNYYKMGKALKGQLNIANNALSVNNSNFDMWKDEVDNLELKLANATTEYETDMYTRQLEAAREKMQESEDKVIENLQMIAQLANDILINSLDEQKGILENAIFGTDAEYYMSKIDRLNKSQEEYLTTTNKMYETNKLIRQAQLDMDQTENKQAKQRYNDYIKDIEQMQQKGKLSEYELSIAQARYKVLEAEIALQEAQDAKSTVRLKRDAEGNFGYVYTADQNKVNDAEQALADANNSLYNIGLQGAQDYQAKYTQTLQDMANALYEIETNMELTDEERKQRREEVEEKYFAQLQTYRELYTTATGLMIDESYEKELDYTLAGIENLGDYESAVETFSENAQQAWSDYDENIATVESHPYIQNLTTNTANLKTASSELAEELIDNVIPTMDKELQKVQDATTAYAEKTTKIYEQRDALQELYEEMLKIAQLEGIELTGEDYSADMAEIIEQYDAGLISEDTYNLYMQSYAKKHFQKAKDLGLDLDYQQLMDDWIANGNKKTDAQYRVYEYLRNLKVDDIMTNERDYGTEITDYVSTSQISDIFNSDGTLNKNLANLFTERQVRIDKGVQTSVSNDDLLKYTFATVYQNLINNNLDDYAEQIKMGALSTLGIDEEDFESEIMSKTSLGNANTTKTEVKYDPISEKEQTEEIEKGNTTAWDMVKDNVNSEWLPIIERIIQSMRPDINNPDFEKPDYAWCAWYVYTKLTEAGVDLSAVPSWGRAAATSYRTTAERLGQWSTTPQIGAIAVRDWDGEYSTDDHVAYVIGIDSEKGTVTTIDGNGGGNLVRERTRPLSEWSGYWILDYSNMSGFDTGGYTGDWGPEGRLAVLHQKEIVLNATDTENILASVSIMREISQILDNNAILAGLRFANLSATGISGLADNVLQQDVHIDANFPNVTDHNEIEMAIDNLINAASQHAYRN